jgi:hypothetical protein
MAQSFHGAILMLIGEIRELSRRATGSCSFHQQHTNWRTVMGRMIGGCSGASLFDEQ